MGSKDFLDISEAKVGLKVYNKRMNQNLIVIHVNSDGVTCLDVRDTLSDRFGTMIVDIVDLQKGWKSSTEIQLIRLRRVKSEA